MCGITGCVGALDSLEELKTYLTLSCEAIQHRGPDETGYYIRPGIALGATRLAIRDPIHGKQPMSRSGKIVVFNGELYHTEKLKKDLESRGYTFVSQGDTEIFLFAFVEFGPKILGELAGMFAFALWDEETETLYLGRDRWGEKPLYYTPQGHGLLFASEIKALQVRPQWKAEISLEALAGFLKNSYCLTPDTGWKNIHKLPPGTFLTWRDGKWTTQRYFSPELDMRPRDLKPTQLLALLTDSVQACAQSDKPLGVFLSGGLDSSTITYLLAKYRGPLPAFSIDWTEADYSEKQYAQEIAHHLNIPHFTVTCHADFLRTHFEKIVDLYDEPFADESMFPTYCLAQFAKQHVDVVLTGDGADEFFHGYERYFFEGTYLQYKNVFSACPDEVLNAILSKEVRFFEKPVVAPLTSDHFRFRSWVDIHTYLPDDILTKVDRATMGVGLEARAPFLTPQVTQFALNCNMEKLADPRQGKKVLREVMRPLLPESIVNREKRGFGVPLKHWFSSSLKEWMLARLLQGSLLKVDWLSQPGIEKIVSTHLAGYANHSRILLNLLVLEHWLRRHYR